MQLTQFADYSLRVLLYAGLHSGSLVRIDDVARAYGISESHLTKVAHNLARLGLLESVRGRGGGIRLNARPEHINLGSTVRLVETNMVVVECFDQEHNTCPIAPACALAGILGAALDAFLKVLDQYTLADVLKNRFALTRLLAEATRE